jgi:hypothetical protein
MTNSDKINEKEELAKQLVLARIDVMPSSFELSIGDKGTFTKKQIIEEINKNSEVGKQVIDMQLNFIKALSTGKLTQTLTQ